jgi:hypothetical protein
VIRDVSNLDILPGGFGLYDWLMLIFLIAVIVAGFAIVLYILALPGKIAISRRHPHAETRRRVEAQRAPPSGDAPTTE